MRRFDWKRYAVPALIAVVFAAGCGPMHKLTKKEPAAGLHLPAKSADALHAVPKVDTVKVPKTITYRKQDGTELFFAPVAVDSMTGEKMMSVAIEEVVISAGSRRNLVERNGKINVEFIVTVPEALQDRSWRLVLDPQLRKGSDTLSLEPLVYTGEKFRELQQREYARYDRYLDRIVDSADYFDRFGRKGVYGRYMRYLTGKRVDYASDYDRLERLGPEGSLLDKKVGWMKPRERRRQYALLRSYVRSTDRKAARRVTYTPDASDRYDHLNDYFAPRYRYEGVDVLPGGEIYTRVGGEYPEEGDRLREAYLQSLALSARSVRRVVVDASPEQVKRFAGERMTYTGRERPLVEGLLREMSDSAMYANYTLRKDYAAGQLKVYSDVDTSRLRYSMLRPGPLERNRQLYENRDRVFGRIVRHPYPDDPRIDTVIRHVDGSLEYRYTEQVDADENTSKLYLYLAGGVESRGGETYRLRKSDTLTYSVASMTTFIDETPRYVQRVITRDAEANARFYFIFPAGKSILADTLKENRRQLAAVRDLTRGLMTDPVYIIDSITLRATSSPEGTWVINERLARERAEALKKVLVVGFREMYDSLKIAASVTLDEHGNEVLVKGSDELPNLPNLLRTRWLAEDWDELRRLIEADTVITDKESVLAMMSEIGNPDTREWRIRAKYPRAYDRMRLVLYPKMRAVDFRFNLHRRGMQQDTIYTTEIDSAYMHALELLKKRRYDDALAILRPYDDRNTALAYMSLGYDAAAYRILRAEPTADTTADIQYMLAILAARLGDEEQAVRYFLRSTELRANLKFRGNLDPEISRLIRRYGLFKEDFE